LSLTGLFAALSVLRRDDLERVLHGGHNLEDVLFVNVNEPLLIEAFVQAHATWKVFEFLMNFRASNLTLRPMTPPCSGLGSES
jgi:hypothetical protein